MIRCTLCISRVDAPTDLSHRSPPADSRGAAPTTLHRPCGAAQTPRAPPRTQGRTPATPRTREQTLVGPADPDVLQTHWDLFIFPASPSRPHSN